MKEEVRSVLQFRNYIIKRVNFEYNFDCEENDEGVNIDFDIDVDFQVNEDNSSMATILKVKIFDNPIDNNYPFFMELEMVGFFSMEIVGDADINSFKSNAIAILFPYVRSLVSVYTANANVEPLILPTININRYMRDKK